MKTLYNLAPVVLGTAAATLVILALTLLIFAP